MRNKIDDKEKKLKNVDAIIEIATGTKSNGEDRKILHAYMNGKITGSEADRLLIELGKQGK